MFFSLLIISLAASTILATPHSLNASPLHHRAIAARVASPQPAHNDSGRVLRRQTTPRCKERPTSSQLSSSSIPLAKSATPPTTTHLQSIATSIQQQVEPVITAKPSPSTTPVQQQPATTTAPSSGSSANLPSFMIGTQTGQGTFYSTGLGACGITNSDADYIAAASHTLFDNFPNYDGVNPNKNPICGRTVTAKYQGKSVTVAITDRCAACAVTDLDFSPSAFGQLADKSVGRISGMTWTWN